MPMTTPPRVGRSSSRSSARRRRRRNLRSQELRSSSSAPALRSTARLIQQTRRSSPSGDNHATHHHPEVGLSAWDRDLRHHAGRRNRGSESRRQWRDAGGPRVSSGLPQAVRCCIPGGQGCRERLSAQRPNGVKGARLAAGYPYTATRVHTRAFAPKSVQTNTSFLDTAFALEPNDEVTVSVWARRAPWTTGWPITAEKRTNGVAGWSLSSQNGSPTNHPYIRVDTSAGSSQVISYTGAGGFEFRRQEFCMMTFALNLGVYRLWINGVFNRSGTYNHGNGLANTSNFSLATATGTACSMDVSIWNRELSDAEVTALYYQGTVPMNGLVLRWPMLEGVGNPQDISGNDYHATTTGTYASRDNAPIGLRAFA